MFDRIIDRLREDFDTIDISLSCLALAQQSKAIRVMALPHLLANVHVNDLQIPALHAYLVHNPNFTSMVKGFTVDLFRAQTSHISALKSVILLCDKATSLNVRLPKGTDSSWHKPSHPTRDAFRALLQAASGIVDLSLAEFVPGMTAILPSRALTRLELVFPLKCQEDLHMSRVGRLEHQFQADKVVFRNLVCYKVDHNEQSIRAAPPNGQTIQRVTQLALQVMLDLFRQLGRPRAVAFQDCRILPAMLQQMSRTPFGQHLETFALDNVGSTLATRYSDYPIATSTASGAVNAELSSFSLRYLPACRKLALGSIAIDLISGFPPLLESVVVSQINVDGPQLWLSHSLASYGSKRGLALPGFSITPKLDYAYAYRDGPQQVHRMDHRCQQSVIYHQAASTDKLLASQPGISASPSFASAAAAVLASTEVLRLAPSPASVGQSYSKAKEAGKGHSARHHTRCLSENGSGDFFMWGREILVQCGHLGPSLPIRGQLIGDLFGLPFPGLRM